MSFLNDLAKFPPFCVFLALALLATPPLVAQEFRGTILGRVTDQSGAAIPGANVTVINEGTNVPSTTITSVDGAYNVPFLTSGTYRIEVEMPGFKKFVQSGVTVAVGQRATVNAVLQVGEIKQ